MSATNHSKQEIRAAIYRAADRVESDPANYNFRALTVGTCGTPMCMWGWIGFELGFKTDVVVHNVSRAIGLKDTDLYYADLPTERICTNAKDATACMRRFADQRFPNECVDVGSWPAVCAITGWVPARDVANEFGAFFCEPRLPTVDYVQHPMGFSQSTLAESARIIRENPELARAMGVEQDAADAQVRP